MCVLHLHSVQNAWKTSLRQTPKFCTARSVQALPQTPKVSTVFAKFSHWKIKENLDDESSWAYLLTEMNRIIVKTILCNNLSSEYAPSNPSLQFETQKVFFFIFKELMIP